MSENPSNGEIYRLCLRIEQKVDKTNGRVDKLEDDNIRIKAYWSAGALTAAIFGDWIKHKLGL